jgi:tryptophanyl-tRNA synthetase
VELAEFMVERLRPFREKHAQLMKDKAFLDSVMKQNARKAHEHAAQTLARVYDKVGFLPKPA